MLDIRLSLGHTVDGRHDEADLSGIGCTRKVRVDLFGLVLVERDEAVQDVIASGSVVRTT